MSKKIEPESVEVDSPKLEISSPILPILSHFDQDQASLDEPSYWSMNPVFLNSIIDELSSEDESLQIHACETFLSSQNLPSLLYFVMDAIVEAKLLPKLMSIIYLEGPSLQTALWVLAVYAKTHPHALLKEADTFTNLLEGGIQDHKILQPSALILSALAEESSRNFEKNKLYGKSYEFRGGVISVLNEVLQSISQEASPPDNDCLFAVSKLCKSICYVKKNVRVTNDRMTLKDPLCELLLLVEENELEICYNICSALYYLTKSGNEEIIDEIVRNGIVPRLVRLLSNTTIPRIRRSVLNVIGNIISSSTDSHTDAVISVGCLSTLKSLMLEPEWTGEVNWIISNVAAGSIQQKENLYQEGFFPIILQVLQSDDITGPKEAIHSLGNILDKGTFGHKRFFRDNGILHLLVALLRKFQDELLPPVIDVISIFLKVYPSLSQTEEAQEDYECELRQLLEESEVLLELSKYQDNYSGDVDEQISYILDFGLNNLAEEL